MMAGIQSLFPLFVSAEGRWNWARLQSIEIMATGFKAYREGASRRVCSPAETLARVQPLVRACGITRVANVTGLDHVGIHVVMAVRPNGASLSVAQGKGIDLEAAKASGVMEAIEQHQAESFAPSCLRLAETREILAEGGVSDELWPRGTERRRAGQKQVWIRAETVRREPGLWVPFELVHLDMSVDHPLAHHAFPLNSNGLASGNTWHEAVVHGLCELIERDAMTLFYLEPPQRQLERRLDLTSVQGASAELLERYQRADVQVALWDITTDLGLPVILCAALDRSPDASRRHGVAIGAGCHLESDVAMARALCEAAQSRLTRIVGSRDDIDDDTLESVRSAESHERWRSLMLQPCQPRPASELPDWRYDSFEEDLAHIQRSLDRCQLSPIATVRLSEPELPICVVRSLVPGLEALSETPGYAPGPRATLRLNRNA